MLNDIINTIEPSQAMLPVWLIGALVVNGGKMIAEAFSDDNSEEESQIKDVCSNEEMRQKVINEREVWSKLCADRRMKYKPINACYISNVDIENMPNIWKGVDTITIGNYQVYPSISADLESHIRVNFKVGAEERVILINDNAFSDKHNQGICITDQRIYVIRRNQDPYSGLTMNWAEITQVEYDNGIFYFIGQGEDYVPIPETLFKRFKDAVDCVKIAEFLSSIASATKPDISVSQSISTTTTVSQSISTTTTVSYTDAEQEYIDELKACMADDGDISASERKLLCSLRRILEITDDRAQELENMCNGTDGSYSVSSSSTKSLI